LVRVGKSDTVPVPVVPTQQNPQVYLYPCSTLISIDIIADITRVVVLVVVLLTVTTVHMMRGGVEVNMTTRAEVTTIVTQCSAAMG